ncbi:hypothetical protein GFS31_41780 (plasmid) [Leptolyngbya sp. BL0902]|uniref:hypothetical protein n=1 Tax=Leptolyngbya sp. BL0902 TaxID=1115757 RepID=UPI0018E767B9|nr:hypothetical protein [Leptolyngbya sp. BL0902]QQE67465.1 hypothetical protein GFS31_41780 [Leptolyngbya sp. BL0902]
MTLDGNALLYTALGSAALGVFCGVQRPASNLTPADLETFANGGQIEYRVTNPYLPLALVLGLTSVGSGLAWAMKGQAPAVAIRQTVPAPVAPAWDGQVPMPTGSQPDRYRVGNPAAILAQRLRPTLISANPRVGKGVTIAHAYRQAQAKGAAVWVIQPKYHPKERGYWADADNVLGFMADELETKEAIEATQEQMQDFIFAWRQIPQRPKVLIIDELAMLKVTFKTWYEAFLKPQLVMELSSGETDDRALWAMTQSSLVGDIGVSGGMRSTFDLLTLQTPTSQGHLESLRASDKTIPAIDDPAIFERSFSPKGAVFYHSALDEWLPMVAYEVPKLEPEELGYAHRTQPEHPPTADHTGAVALPQTPVSEFVEGQNTPDLALILAVTNALHQGMPRSQIIKDVLGYKGQRYQQGAELYDRIKSIIEENSTHE